MFLFSIAGIIGEGGEKLTQYFLISKKGSGRGILKLMVAIGKLVSQIRCFTNNPWEKYVLMQNMVRWHMLCSSLDVIEDIEYAISFYDQQGYLFECDGSRYILIYGILQGLVVQQEAVSNLCEALEICYDIDPELKNIREIRNDSIGHPTKRGKGKAFNFISRASISKCGYDLITIYSTAKEPRYRRINIPSLIERQQLILIGVLSGILKDLKKKEAEHKAMFKSDYVQDVFPETLSYYFEKIYEAIIGGKPVEFGFSHIKFIIEVVEKFKAKLEGRGILNTSDAIMNILKLLDYPIEQLSAYFSQSGSSISGDKDAYIFTFFIDKHIKKLREIAGEIDEQYNVEDT